MSHAVSSFLAGVAFAALVICLPGLWTLYTIRGSTRLEPEKYASLFVLAAVAGILLFLPALSIIAVTALLALGLAWLTARYALAGVEYERVLWPPRLFPGDTAELTLYLHNRKLLPLSWFLISEPVWLGVLRDLRKHDSLLEFSAGMTLADNFDYTLTTRGAVGPFQSVRRRLTVTARQRGVYAMGPAHIVAGDPFSLFERTTTVGGLQEIVVYPKIYRETEPGFPFRQSVGELQTRRSLLEDPTLMAGSREYRPGDALRRVHWKATARTSELQVRVFDPSTTAQVMIVVNLNTFRHIWEGIGLERMEETISAAASLAIWALEHDFAVGLSSNGLLGGVENDTEAPRLAPSAHPRQGAMALEHLARLSFGGRYAAERVLLDEAVRLSERTSILFVTSIITPELAAALTDRRLDGRVSAVYCGRHAAPVIRGVPIHLVTPHGDEGRAAS